MSNKNNLKELLSDNEIYELKLAGLINQIESGEYMPKYIDWLAVNQPELELRWPHVKFICQHIQDVIDGKIKKLAISMHPRIGKTSLVSVPLPAYYLAKDPRNKIILAGHTQTFANKLSVKVRSLSEKAGVPVHKTRRARDDWSTDFEGGLKAVGTGSGSAGYGCELLICDDPIRGRKDANSPAMQNMLFDWWYDELIPRRNTADVPAIIIATRWGEMDLIGQILSNEGEYSEDNQDGWVVINLPAIAMENDPLGRKPGEALCPDRFNILQLRAIQKVMKNFDALYQGNPSSASGGFFRREDIKFVDRIPKSEEDLRFVRFWDLGATTSGDYTVGTLMAHSRKSKNVFVVNAVRGRWGTWERENVMLDTARKDFIQYGRVAIRLEKQPGAAGIDSYLASAKNLQGFDVRGVRPTGDKVTRAEPFSAAVASGAVYFVKGEWNKDAIQEMLAFPFGKFDDFCDSASGAFNELVTRMGHAFIKIS